MASPIFVTSQSETQWSAAMSLGAAAVWAAFATLAGLRRAPFGIIELLFLFAPLVIVPLGLELNQLLTGPRRSRLARALHLTQFPVALAVCIAFWLPPGRTSAVLSALWLLQCVLLACHQFLQSREKKTTQLSLTLNIAHFDLILGAAWLVISRAGGRPMGFQEPIILLTAVHFHYSGFATGLIASLTLREFQKKRLPMPGLQTLVLLVVLLPFVLAAGFVFSPLLRFVTAIALSICVTALGMVSWWIAGKFLSRPAGLYLRSASCAAAAAFSLAGLYAVSEYFGKGWITVPGMANSHGVLNGLGFVLLSLLAWLIELHESESDRELRQVPLLDEKHANGPIVPARGNAGTVPTFESGRPTSPIPEFVAREFYDP